MGILFLILAIVFFVLWTKEKKSSKEKSDQMEDSLSKANKRLEELSKYQQILDVETWCKNLQSDAELEAMKTRSLAESAAKEMRSSAQSDAEKMRSSANLMLMRCDRLLGPPEMPPSR